MGRAVRMARVWALLLPSLLLSVRASGQEPIRRYPTYDRLDAGREAYALGEERRRYLIDRQRWLNDEMVFWSRSFPGWRYFVEPWPFLPGDIYGYPLAEPPINQPIGQTEEQIGPDTWFSRPVYEDEFEVEPLEIDAADDEWAVQPAPTGPREF